MKKYLCVFLFTALGVFGAKAQIICNNNGSMVLFTNYDGGNLNINVDVNIPNIKICVVSYEAVSINLSGAYVNNVTAVYYAGYNNPNNNACPPAVPTTVVTGAGAAAVTILFAPASPLANVNGYPSIICGYSCDTSTNQGGCNTIDQIEAYFSAQFPGSIIRSHKVQYNCWQTLQSISGGGTCCLGPAQPLNALVSSIQPSCNGMCNGSLAAVGSGGTPPYTYQWVGGPATAVWPNLCPGTYSVIVMDAVPNSTVVTGTIINPPPIVTTLTQASCDSFTFNGNLLTTSGTYYDTILSGAACDTFVTLNLTINTANVNVTQAGAVLTATATGATYKWLNCTTSTLIPGATGQSYTATQTGSYAVIVTQNGCSDTSLCKTVTVAGISQTEENKKIVFYPNPVDNELTLEVDPEFIQSTYLLTDASGRIVSKEKLTSVSNKIPMAHLSKGIYFLKVEGSARQFKIQK